MPGPSTFAFTFGRSGTPREPEEPMRLLLLGDFSGRPAAERPPLATRPTLRVDLDTFDAAIRRLAPRIVTPEATIAIALLDDFHPDALLAKVDLFRQLREARSRPAPQGDDSPLAALLGGNASKAPAPSSGGSKTDDWLNALLQRVVAPHIVPDTSGATKAYLDAIDASIATEMRRVLHAPAFQALEANWRGVHWLLANLELDEQLQLHLLDVTAEELQGDLDRSPDGDVLKTAAHGVLIGSWRGQPGGQRWSAMIGLYGFGPSIRDLSLLGALGAIASHSGCPFLASATSALWRAPDPDLAAWNTLRTSGAAPWIGLVAPRMLLRLPYGARQEKVETFAFEELGNTPEHDHYLWAPGSIAAAALLGRSYRLAEGWDFSTGDEREIEDLPACTRLDAHGEPELVPVAEAFLPDAASERLLATGLMPLLSHRHRNAAQLARFQSIASPAAPLNGLPA